MKSSLFAESNHAECEFRRPANLEDEYKSEFGKITGGIKTASAWASQLAKDTYLRRALNREGHISSKVDDEEDEEENVVDDFVSARELPQFAKYTKMLSMHMPLGAVCGRMRRDRVDIDAIDAFMNDESFKEKKKENSSTKKKRKSQKRRSTKKKSIPDVVKEEVQEVPSIAEPSSLDFAGPPPTPPPGSPLTDKVKDALRRARRRSSLAEDN